LEPAEDSSVADLIAQQVFGLLFDSTDAAFIVHRGHGRVVSANVRAADLLARDLDAIVGMSLAELSYDPDRTFDVPGHYEEVAFRRSDDYPIYVELQVAHVSSPEHGEIAAFMARDTSERRSLERELQAKHSALFTAHADLERAHSQLETAKVELETRNREIALLAWRAAMGEVVAGIAHHLNNPVGALASTVRRLDQLTAKLPAETRGEQERLLARVTQITRRIESNVAAIVKASQSTAQGNAAGRLELPPELATVLTTFTERLDDIPTKAPTKVPA
jgi:PAS domain-containing protein